LEKSERLWYNFCENKNAMIQRLMRSKCNFNILGHKIMKKIIFSFALLSFMFLGVSFAFA